MPTSTKIKFQENTILSVVLFFMNLKIALL